MNNTFQVFDHNGKKIGSIIRKDGETSEELLQRAKKQYRAKTPAPMLEGEMAGKQREYDDEAKIYDSLAPRRAPQTGMRGRQQV